MKKSKQKKLQYRYITDTKENQVVVRILIHGYDRYLSIELNYSLTRNNVK